MTSAELERLNTPTRKKLGNARCSSVKNAAMPRPAHCQFDLANRSAGCGRVTGEWLGNVASPAPKVELVKQGPAHGVSLRRCFGARHWCDALVLFLHFATLFSCTVRWRCRLVGAKR